MLKELAVLLVFQSAFCMAAFAAIPLPKGYTISPDSTSPNGEYCVIEPLWAVFNHSDETYNAIVNAKTGKLIAKIHAKLVIKGKTYDSVGIHEGPQFMDDHALWSPDSSTLVWTVNDKWGPDSITVIRFANHHVISQTDLRTPIDNEMLKRTKRAHPKIYAKAVKENKGNGSWYPDGFTIDIHVNPLTTNEVTFIAALTSDPKGPTPSYAEITALIDGAARLHGKITFRDFRSYLTVGEAAFQKAADNYNSARDQLAVKLPKSKRAAFLESEKEWEDALERGPFLFSFSPILQEEKTPQYQKRAVELEKRAAAISH